MAYGMTNSGGNAAYKANQAIALAREAMAAVGSGGVPVDSESSVEFKLGCDANGVYMVMSDAEEEDSEEEEGNQEGETE